MFVSKSCKFCSFYVTMVDIKDTFFKVCWSYWQHRAYFQINVSWHLISLNHQLTQTDNCLPQLNKLNKREVAWLAPSLSLSPILLTEKPYWNLSQTFSYRIGYLNCTKSLYDEQQICIGFIYSVNTHWGTVNHRFTQVRVGKMVGGWEEIYSGHELR